MTMWQIVSSIVNNQASGGKWLISESIIDTVRVYIYWYGDDVDEVLNMELEHMVEYQGGLAEARQMIRNLEETHMKIWENVRIKLDK